MAAILQQGRSRMEAKRQHIVQLKPPLLLCVLSGLLPLMIAPQSVEPLQAHLAPKFSSDKGVIECIHNTDLI
jgi:hypothetical protein